MHDYARHYDELFWPIREERLKILEIGVEFGHSARVWLQYFPVAQLYGVDIKKQHDVDDPRFHFTEGDQRSVTFWKDFIDKNGGGFNIILDDGCHHTSGIIPTFFALWPHVVSGGYYAVEDLMCSYLSSCDEPGWPKQVEFLKRMVDEINIQTAYVNTPEQRVFPRGLHGSLGIEWIRFSEELAILKRK